MAAPATDRVAPPPAATAPAPVPPPRPGAFLPVAATARTNPIPGPRAAVRTGLEALAPPLNRRARRALRRLAG